MNKKTCLLGILIGLALIALVALGGSSGAWDRFTVPPIVVAALVAVSLQWIGFGVAWKMQSERFFDLVGSVTFVTVILVAILYSRSELGALDVALSLAVAIWAARLGSFLFVRVLKVGSDNRFDAIKRNFLWFLMTWTLQGTWVVVTAAPVMAVVGDGLAQPLGVIEVFGLALWVVGLSIEVVSDSQKKKFRQEGEDSFITSGLWSRSRHPNYFGEILLWCGLAVSTLPALEKWQLLTLISPVFVWALLMKISGAPMLEAKAKRRWGDDTRYREYVEDTPLLVPRFR